ncbi:hypothetical protein HAX54_013125 [Datura stramonium]|uniref:Uncharacterized protein n=1 Tax=Datura stramonium TaxID=4076 RepID=A0ABS8TMJ8_DATST|nr:hypothetical protein [Datura stramonium]
MNGYVSEISMSKTQVLEQTCKSEKVRRGEEKTMVHREMVVRWSLEAKENGQERKRSTDAKAVLGAEFDGREESATSGKMVDEKGEEGDSWSCRCRRRTGDRGRKRKVVAWSCHRVCLSLSRSSEERRERRPVGFGVLCKRR